MSNDSDDLNTIKPSKNKGGRPIGIISGTRRELFLLCGKQKLDVFEEILKLCKNDDISIKLSALGMAAKHLYPTLKAVEISGELDVNHEEKRQTIDHMKKLYEHGLLDVTKPTKKES